MPLPAVGSLAPDFTLPSTAGHDVTLSTFRGRKVLLAFFPLAFTSTCTAQLCSMSEDYAAFEAAGAVVFGISVDSVPALRAYRAQERLTVDLLSDFRREVCRLYGTLLEDQYFSARAYVVVQEDGTVGWTFVEEMLGHRRENAELLAHLQSAETA